MSLAMYETTPVEQTFSSTLLERTRQKTTQMLATQKMQTRS
jgi:hypothetical protein